jgi:hypothetical protein
MLKATLPRGCGCGAQQERRLVVLVDHCLLLGGDGLGQLGVDGDERFPAHLVVGVVQVGGPLPVTRKRRAAVRQQGFGCGQNAGDMNS